MGKNKVVTVPNIISAVRIVIIPFIIWSYFVKEYWACFALILFSGLSDLIDGYLARRFKQVSDFGKILDPIADKLTQSAVILTLFLDHLDYWAIWFLLIVLLTKELLTLICATYMLNNGAKTISAKWWGKISTFTIYVTMLLIVLSKNGIKFVNDTIITVMAVVSVITLLVSVAGYFKLFFIAPKKNKEK